MWKSAGKYEEVCGKYEEINCVKINVKNIKKYVALGLRRGGGVSLHIYLSPYIKALLPPLDTVFIYLFY